MSNLKAPRRLLMTADAVGGVWTYALELAEGLGRQGVRTLLAVMGPEPSSDKLEVARRIEGLDIVRTGLDLEWRDRKGLDVPEARETLLRIARRFGPDLVHVNGFREATFPFGVPVLLAAHSDVRTWWRACHHGAEPPPEWHRYLMAVHAGLAAADRIVVPSRAFRSQLEAVYGAMLKARVVPNGRDLPAPAPGPRLPYVLTAGRVWDRAKNIVRLEELALRLPWPVFVVGHHREGQRHAGVVYLGELRAEALWQRMCEAEIFCSPALYEPFGLAVLEAAAAGAALVLSDIPAFRELWKGAAHFVPADDERRLERALTELTEDSWERRRLQAAARERAARLGRGPMVRGYLELYAELLARPTTAWPRRAAAA